MTEEWAVRKERLYEIHRKLDVIHGEWDRLRAAHKRGLTPLRLLAVWRAFPEVVDACEDLLWEVERLRRENSE